MDRFTSDPLFWVLWDIVNIAVPILLIPLAMLIVCSVRSADPRYAENGHVLTVVKDGQMGFVTVSMAAATAMEMLGKTLTVTMLLAMLGLVAFAFAGALVAAIGALYTVDRCASPRGGLSRMRHYALMWASFIFAASSAAITHYARWHLII
jgi:hypothetical protein